MLISYKSYINEKKLGQLFESGTWHGTSWNNKRERKLCDKLKFEDEKKEKEKKGWWW